MNTPCEDTDIRLRHAVMQARGAAAMAMAIIDNGGEDPAVLLAKVRAELDRGYNGEPPIRRVPCERGHDWWTSAEFAGCPECGIATWRGDAA